MGGKHMFKSKTRLVGTTILVGILLVGVIANINKTKANVDTTDTNEEIELMEHNEVDLYWVVPFTKNVTTHFEPNRTHPITGKVQPHNGIDISAPKILNQPVVSAKAGKVIFSGTKKRYGNVVIVDHGNGFETRYAHLNFMSVTEGMEVEGGEVIGEVGTTGETTSPLLHFETRIDGKPYDPLKLYR